MFFSRSPTQNTKGGQEVAGFSSGAGVVSSFPTALSSTRNNQNSYLQSPSQLNQSSYLQAESFSSHIFLPSESPLLKYIDQQDDPSIAQTPECSSTLSIPHQASSDHIDLLKTGSNSPGPTLCDGRPIPKVMSEGLEPQPSYNTSQQQHLTDTLSRGQDHLQKVPFQSLSICSSSKSVQLISSQSSNIPILMSQRGETAGSKHEIDGMSIDYCGALATEKSSANCKISQEVDEAFAKFGPLLRRVNANNICAFLVEFLKTYHQHIPLENLFRLLYYGNVIDSESASTAKFSDTETSESVEPKLTAIKFCRIILVKLQPPPAAMDIGLGSVTSTPASAINYHELLRTFLAVKIIFASIKKVDDSNSSNFTIPRLSVYKVYYILCQTLIQQSANVSNCANQSIILGQSKLGKLTNMVFPNSITKRLGKRGKSKYHYIGFIWDTSLVDENMLKLSELEIPELRDHFKKLEKLSIQKGNSNSSPSIPRPKLKPTRKPSENPLSTTHLPVNTKPLHTYAELSYTFPDIDCSPRVWETIPKSIPQRSTWAQENLQRSLVALEPYKVDLNPLVHDFTVGNFAIRSHESLSIAVFQVITTLKEVVAPNEAYLHLYLVILLIIFPIVLASDTEVDVAMKIAFQSSVKHCIAKLESETANTSCINETHLTIFIGVLKKMVRFNEMTSWKIKVPYNESVLNEMITHLETALSIPKTGFSDRSPLETIYTRSIIMSMNAYNFRLVDDSTASQTQLVETIADLARIFKNSAKDSKNKMQMMLQTTEGQGSDHVPQDVSYQVVKASIQNFHERTLTTPLAMKLPMAVVTFIIRHFTNSMQYASLHDSKKGDPDFAKECFRGCWVFSSMYQEYMRLISEVVALNKILSRDL